jgi:hypothetical protein
VSDNDYDVGYGKPPKSGRFKKGKSGNPRGRPKKEVRPPWEVFKDEMDRMVKIKEADGSVSEISMWNATLRQLIQKAAKGDLSAIRLITQLQEKQAPVEMRHQLPQIILYSEDMSADDED